MIVQKKQLAGFDLIAYRLDENTLALGARSESEAKKMLIEGSDFVVEKFPETATLPISGWSTYTLERVETGTGGIEWGIYC